MNHKINWFPGHMKKSLEELDRNLKIVDVVIYLLDARCPKSCINPSFDDAVKRKKIIYVHSKKDLAPDPKRGDDTGTSVGNIINQITKLFPNKIGLIKAMVIGVPNVGKSTLINKLGKRKKAATGNKPGVTKQTQWVEVTPRIYLLDTPGILMPNMEIERVAKNLAYIGTIKDEILDIEDLARNLLLDLKITNRHVTDLKSAYSIVRDFREGKFGKFNLDKLS